MKPDAAVSFVVPFGAWQSRTIGWIAKCERRDGLLWLLKQWNSSRVNPDFREAMRAFFACPRYAPWFEKVLGKEYPGKEAFWLPYGHHGCRACGESGMAVETDTISCKHGTPKAQRHSAKCECGYQAVVETPRKVDCPACRVSEQPAMRLVDVA